MSYDYRYDLQSSLQKERSEKTGSIQAPVAKGQTGKAVRRFEAVEGRTGKTSGRGIITVFSNWF